MGDTGADIPFPGVFLTVAPTEGWKDGPSPERQRHTLCKRPRRLSPPSSITLRILAALLHSWPRWERPSSKLEILTPSCFPIGSSTHKQNEARRAAPQAKSRDWEAAGGSWGSPRSGGEHRSGPGGERADRFGVPNPGPKRHVSPPPRCKTRHEQYVHSLLLKIISRAMSLPPSLPPQNQARGSAPTLAPSSASSHAISAQHSWRNTYYSSTAKNFVYTFTYARLTACLQKAPQTQTDPAWSGQTCFLLFPPAQLEFNPCVNLVHAIPARDRARHGGPVPPTQPTSPPPPPASPGCSATAKP